MILHEPETQDVPLPDGGTMRMHLRRPAQEGRFPAVVLFSEIYQVTAPIARLASMIAGNGYVVGIPEVYHEHEPPGSVLRYDAAGTARGNELKYLKPVDAYDADATAALSALAASSACDGRLATFGVCLGGHLAYRAALDTRVAAAACFYPTDLHAGSLGLGRSDDSLARMTELRAETVFVWGRQDPHIPPEGRALVRARLEEVGAHYEWHEVNAQHVFLRDEGPRFDPELYMQGLQWTLALYRRAFARCRGDCRLQR